jgi:sulfatase maturation enzyme AslB (radical SAM superfamily)
MESLTLSINPWYFCNFRCDFCYLTNNQLSDKTLLSLDILEQRLIEVISRGKIEMVDLYGGEISLLPIDYIMNMKELLHAYGIYKINVITNLSVINEIITDPDFYISVSYDFDAREKNELVFRNMTQLQKPFSILTLASEKLMKKNVSEMISTLNLLKNLQSVEIKPYSSNQANQHNISYTEYEEFIKKYIMSDIHKNFIFVNENNILSSVNKEKNSFSDDHIYITPSGKYAVLEFDLNDNEFFLEYDTLDEYYNWCEREKLRVKGNKFCSKCDYFGSCLTEHYRYVHDLKNGCNGYVGLIKWYANERMENTARVIS